MVFCTLRRDEGTGNDSIIRLAGGGLGETPKTGSDYCLTKSACCLEVYFLSYDFLSQFAHQGETYLCSHRYSFSADVKS